MKVKASVVFSFQSSSLAETGALLDEILRAAHERDDVDVDQINVMTPPGATPVSLPALSPSGEYPPGAPRSGEIDGR